MALTGEEVDIRYYEGVARNVRPLIPQRDGTVIVPLANARGFALVDAADAELVGRYNWRLSTQADSPGRAYAVAGTWDPVTRKSGAIYLHQVLLPVAVEVDHVNCNGLDNRRQNLRPATRREQSRNTRRLKATRSGYKGVRPIHGRWQAYISTESGFKHLGMFDTPEGAAAAYDWAAGTHFGRFARTNFSESNPYVGAEEGLSVRKVPPPVGLGEANTGAKLTTKQVLDIRAANGKQQDIADRFGVSRSLISMIKNHKVWGHLSDGAN